MWDKIVSAVLTLGLISFGARQTATTAQDSSVEQMGLARAKDLLIRREGRRRDVYYDSRNILTVGIGHKVLPSDNLKYGQIISDAQIDAFFQKDIGWAFAAAKSQMADLGKNDPDFLAALTSVNFQLGAGWKNEFANTYNALRQGNYIDAIRRLETSLWHKQTPTRVSDFKQAIVRAYT